MNDSFKGVNYLWIWIIVSILIILAWFLFPSVVLDTSLISKFEDVSINDMTKYGQYGDAYGSLNTLFSGLAFAGVLISILMQSKELQLQRDELINSRIQLESQARSLVNQLEAMKDDQALNLFNNMLDLTSEHLKNISVTINQPSSGAVHTYEGRQAVKKYSHYSSLNRIGSSIYLVKLKSEDDVLTYISVLDIAVGWVKSVTSPEQRSLFKKLLTSMHLETLNCIHSDITTCYDFFPSPEISMLDRAKSYLEA